MRRVALIAGHLQPPARPAVPQKDGAHATSIPALATQHTAATNEGAPQSSYAKVHGEVSEAHAEWRQIPVVQKNSLQEVIYQKAVQEGIAKVSQIAGRAACFRA